MAKRYLPPPIHFPVLQAKHAETSTLRSSTLVPPTKYLSKSPSSSSTALQKAINKNGCHRALSSHAGQPQHAQRSTNIIQRSSLPTSGKEIVSYGANQSLTVHIVNSDWKKSKEKNKIDKMYPTGSSQLSVARSYAGERPRQILRWLSTAVFKIFPNSVEIQCYFDISSGKIYISSNVTSINKKISSCSSGLFKIIGEIHGSLSEEDAGRTSRHFRKLLIRGVYKEQTDIMDALKNGDIVVPLDDHSVDLHAERRIAAMLKEQGKVLDPQFLAGVKRPCMACFYALNLINSRPGPLWPSKPGSFGYDPEKLMKHAYENGVISYAALDRFNRTVVLDHDSDSESDKDD
ncbi:hypothetical protein [Niveispirillum irakense]|uniref:hypothetical protein n=1 Tax=Niveispirillum irakense TaxID=34011 RepID=UPI0012B5F6E5|nr:hypothetical protein [Niveispirillum irakense]